jgi:uncharacterized membrane protein YgdD (TMEM256/DUF423 family)
VATTRAFLFLGSVFGFIAVALGAFGAHALKERLDPGMLAVFETGVRYEMYHALALLAVAWAAAQFPQSNFALSGWFFTAGIIIFSGSLYLLSITGTRWLGAVTPLGGLCFLVGWASLAWQGWSLR